MALTTELNLPTLEKLKDTKTVFEEAEDLVGTVRRQQYGPAQVNFRRIADMWNAVLHDRFKGAGCEINRDDVAIMMVCLKLSRWCESPDKRDNIVDACGYLRLIEIMRDELQEEPLQ